MKENPKPEYEAILGNVYGPPRASWQKLNEILAAIKFFNPEHPIWSLIKTKPLTCQVINQVITGGCSVMLLAIFTEEQGYYNIDSNKIELSAKAEGYTRDKVLFHELVHCWYGPIINDGYQLFSPDLDRIKARENRFIAEWLGRKYRADPELLRHAVLGFKLKSQIYDQVSWEAFSSTPSPHQIYFQPSIFVLDRTLMD